MFVIKMRRILKTTYGQWIRCYETTDGADCATYLRRTTLLDGGIRMEYVMEYIPQPDEQL